MELLIVSVIVSIVCGIVFLAMYTVCTVSYYRVFIPKINTEMQRICSEQENGELNTFITIASSITYAKISDYEKKQSDADIATYFLRYSAFEKGSKLHIYQNYYKCIRMLYFACTLFLVIFPLLSIIVCPIISTFI